MAIFHLTAKVISRGKGQSAIAAAAYRSGERLQDEQTSEQKLYLSRAQRIEFTAIMTPSNAPAWAQDRNALWNHAERAEKRKDAQLAREIEVALPHELTAQQREYLVKDFAREAFVRKGYAVDIAIHAPDHEKSDERNHHAHIMVTMRTVGAEGFASKKDRNLNTSEQLGQWREQWAHLANRHLERHGHNARIDHRSLEAQGIEREATIHLGYAASEIDRRGGQSDRMDALKTIIGRNDTRLEIKGLDGELAGLERQAKEISPTAYRLDETVLNQAALEKAISAVAERPGVAFAPSRAAAVAPEVVASSGKAAATPALVGAERVIGAVAAGAARALDAVADVAAKTIEAIADLFGGASPAPRTTGKVAATPAQEGEGRATGTLDVVADGAAKAIEMIADAFGGASPASKPAQSVVARPAEDARNRRRQQLLRDFDREIPQEGERDAKIERDRTGRERTRGE